jgi:ribulose-5-phosphate 4-epimerase/fuculose-1-phosphate aldolase
MWATPTHPEVQAAIEDAIARILKAGKAPGILTSDVTQAKHYLSLGALFVAVGLDTQIFGSSNFGIGASIQARGWHRVANFRSGVLIMLTHQLPVARSLQNEVHPKEWEARVQLAACYRVFAFLGWTEMIYNHITLRLPQEACGSEKQFLINPFGLHYSEVTASNLVKIDLKGKALDGSPYPVNPAGFTVHAALHDNLSEAHCVMHTHTTAGVSVACMKEGLQQTNFYTAQLHNMIAYHDFEGITIHSEEAPRLLKSIGNKQAVILRNHGLLSWGATLPQTFAILWTLQRACEIQLATFSMGGPFACHSSQRGRCSQVHTRCAAIQPEPWRRQRCIRCPDSTSRSPIAQTRGKLPLMKVCIYGAGAIGGWIGVHLARTGHEVSVVARGATLAALQKMVCSAFKRKRNLKRMKRT